MCISQEATAVDRERRPQAARRRLNSSEATWRGEITFLVHLDGL